jgi:hypothetical protein
MTRLRSPIRLSALAVAVALNGLSQIALSTWIYTSGTLQAARQQGIFLTAEEGMLSLIARGYPEPWDAEIILAGPNSFDGSSPHVWYVIACVWADRRVDGSLVGHGRGYDQPGSFFLHTKEGWVHVSEGAFPELLGALMRFYGLAGPGSSRPSHEWRSAPHTGCIHQAAEQLDGAPSASLQGSSTDPAIPAYSSAFESILGLARSLILIPFGDSVSSESGVPCRHNNSFSTSSLQGSSLASKSTNS